MALLSLSKIEQLFGKTIKLADVSGSVDGTNHMDLVPGETFELTNKLIEDGGNFVCREGKRVINGVERSVQTVGWITPQGRFLALGSLYKKNAAGQMNPKNTGVPTNSVNRADLLPLLFGKKVTIGDREEIQVPVFRPAEGEPKTKDGSWYSFAIA